MTIYEAATLLLQQDSYFGKDLIDNDGEPDPVHTVIRIYSHGTRCAGQIGMKANNLVCGVGIAPLATIGGDAFSYFLMIPVAEQWVQPLHNLHLNYTYSRHIILYSVYNLHLQ